MVSFTAKGGQPVAGNPAAVTADPLEVLSDRGRFWATLWGRDRAADAHGAACSAYSACAPPPGPPPDDDECLRAFDDGVRGYSRKKARGVDHWSVNELKQLCRPARVAFGKMMHRWLATSVLPQQFLYNLMPLIPKPGGGERGVAKTALSYRVWCRWRRPVIKQWEDGITAEWDCCRSGSSAEFAASRRLLEAELAKCSGQEVGMNLWDVEKFFDSVDFSLLVARALRWGYPASELAVACQVHLAPRALQVMGAVGLWMPTTSGVLPGCGQAVPLARVYLRSDMQEVALSSGAKLGTYVDDVTQLATGCPNDVVQYLVDGGLAMAGSMSTLRLRISPKSVVVCSSVGLARTVSKMLNRKGVPIKVEVSARDLGIRFAAGRPIRSLDKEALGRLRGSLSKLARIARYSKQVRAVRVTATTGAMPQALWGLGAIGAADTTIASCRSRMVDAAGVGARGCVTTTLALHYGPLHDPGISMPLKVVTSWLALVQKDRSLWARVHATWQRVHDEVVVGDKPMWHKVRGPMGAVIATLHQAGWVARFFEVWRDPVGDRYVLEPGFPIADFAAHLAHHLGLRLWRQAADHWCGRGLEGGVAVRESFAWHRRLLEAGEFRKAGLLAAILTGSLWPPCRIAAAKGLPLPKCTFCGEEDDMVHQLWLCPRWDAESHPDIASTQRLRNPREDIVKEEGLWLRGLLPAHYLAVESPTPSHWIWHFVGTSQNLRDWPGGTYFTDGSGGTYSSSPALRRCGLAVCQLRGDWDDGDLDFEWGAFSALPGSKQTVPRAEFAAIWAVLHHVPADRACCVVSDSKISVDAVLQLMECPGRAVDPKAANLDLLVLIGKLLVRRVGSFSIRWVKGHSNDDDLTNYSLRPGDVVGNAAADKLADRAALMARVAPGDVARVKWGTLTAAAVQRRLVAIHTFLLDEPHEHRVNLRKQRAIEKARLRECRLAAIAPTLPAAVLCSAHRVVGKSAAGGSLFCTACLEVSPPGGAGMRAWLASPCSPLALPPRVGVPVSV